MVATVGRRDRVVSPARHAVGPRPPRHAPRALQPRHLHGPPRRDPLRTVRPILSAAAVLVASAATLTTSLDESAEQLVAASPIVPAAVAPVVEECGDRASVATRAALTLVIGLPGVTRADDPLVDLLTDVGVGGVMLRDENLRSEAQARRLVEGLRDRLGEHLLVAVDEEGGRVTSLRAVGGSTPSARRLGRAGAAEAREAGEELGELAADLGIDWVFAPVVDLDGGPAGGVIGDRSYGDDPDEVAEAAGAFAEGVQAAGVAVTVKHFPGHGAADSDPHAVAAIDDRSRAALLRSDVVPFDALIDDGAEAVMVGHVTYPEVWGDLPASLTPGAYELLRDRGFEGVAITDALGMGAVYHRWGFGVAPAMAVAAGADAVLVNQGDRVLELHQGLVAAVELGDLDEDRLDEAVARVLALRGQDPSGILCPG